MTKSSFSNSTGNCVDVELHPSGAIGVRDTKLGDDSPVLWFTTAEWIAFLKGVHEGEFSLNSLADNAKAKI